MSKPARPILRYHGGKWMLADWIISHFPAHRVYVEPFGGAASVLLQKQRSYAEVYNDLDSEIVNLFRVVRDRGDELRQLLALTPFAREEYQGAWYPSDDPLEQARRTVIRAFMGFASAAVTLARAGGSRRPGQPGTGFRANSNRSGTTPAHDWRNFAGTGFRTYTGEPASRQNRHTLPAGDWASYEDALTPIIQRLRGVVIENRDAKDVIRAHDADKALHYLDPPYPHGTRDVGHDYRHELTDDDHRELAEIVTSLKGAVVLSGYACELYDEELYPDWRRLQRKALGDGAVERTEVLWLNEAAATTTPQLRFDHATV